MKSKFKIAAVALISFLAAACQQTFEDDDYHQSSSIHGEADNDVWEKIDEAAQGG